MQKIDVCVNVFGKPWQTLVTLRSLYRHSGPLIDTLYFIEEARQPAHEKLGWAIEELVRSGVRMAHFVPRHHLWVSRTDIQRFRDDREYRHSVRYQYAIEATDKKHLLLIHNDVLFQDDVVTPLVTHIRDHFGIGRIGQCWNCPLHAEGRCDSTRFQEVSMTYDDVMEIVQRHPESRTHQNRHLIDTVNPMPMPECRINEWCCLIDVGTYRKEVVPRGNVPPIGGHFRVDTGDAWFAGMVRNGHQAVHYDISRHLVHGYFSDGAGHPSLFFEERYSREETSAKEYYLREFAGTTITGAPRTDSIGLADRPAGVVRPIPVPSSRNAPCPCESGKKYKHCHGQMEAPPEQPV